MAQCKVIRRKHRKICIGDLDTEIVIQTRSIKAPTVDVDFSEAFTGDIKAWAKLDTLTGATIFNDSNEEVDITHVFTVRYLCDITSENWVLFDSRRFNILDIEDLDERKEWLVLRCNVRGSTSKRVNDA